MKKKLWPGVSVLIPTYNRAQILYDTITSLCTYIHYSGVVSIYVGVDGNDNTFDVLREAQTSVLFDDMFRMHVLEGPRRKTGTRQGLGANLNMLINATRDNILMQMDDDHQLDGLCKLDPHVKELLDNPLAGWIRLYGIANHHLTATLEGNYWRVHWDSSGDYSLYITSNRPHIKLRSFHDFYGLYPEGENLTLGDTEEAFCHQCKGKAMRLLQLNDDMEIPHVMIPLNLQPHSENGWKHVGESWQSKGE